MAELNSTNVYGNLKVTGDIIQEVGSCTLILKDSAGNSATMGPDNVAVYTRIGKLVFVTGTINWTSTSSLIDNSRLRIYGIPYPCKSSANCRAVVSFGTCNSGAFNITRSEFCFVVDPAYNFIWGTKISGNNLDGELYKVDIGTAGTIYGFSLTYMVD